MSKILIAKKLKPLDVANLNDATLSHDQGGWSPSRIIDGGEITKSLRGMRLTLVEPENHQSHWYKADECLRKFLFTERLGFRTYEHSIALFRGQIVHLVTEFMHKGKSQKRAMRAAAQLRDDKLEEIKLHTNRAGYLPDHSLATRRADEVNVEHDKGVAMALAFWRNVPPDKRYELIASEKNIRLQLPFLNVPLNGTLDMVLRHTETGKIFIRDLKTTTQPSESVIGGMRFDMQWVMYRLLAREKFGSARGVLVDVLRSWGIKFCPDTKDKPDLITGKDSWDSYINRGLQWWRDEAEKKPDDLPLVRKTVTFTGPLITPETANKLVRMDTLCTQAPSPDLYYRNRRACYGPYKNSPCPFIPLCHGSEKTWPITIRDRFRQDFTRAGSTPAERKEGDEPRVKERKKRKEQR